jgi:LuxR family maltose regulon positive regulatory protein
LGALEAHLALLCDQLAPALRWGETCGLRCDDPLTPQLSSLDYLAYVTLARVFLARGRLQRDTMALTQAFILLDQLRDIASGRSLAGWLIEIEMLTALALQAQGKTRRALTTLGPILARAEPEGYVRLFADEGQPMTHLLAQVSPYTAASPGYLQSLQAALPLAQRPLPGVTPQSEQSLFDPLSPRELDVLRLLGAGCSNQQIAQRLVISLYTAKRHVQRICAKLTAANRTQAVVRARALHML